MGLFGITPPTKDINVTASLAFMSIILIEVSGIHAKGGKGYLKSFAEPMVIMAPINFLELFIRPLSLCMRLFGNILGGFVVMELLKIVVPIIVPVPFSFYFDIFDGLIQAYVFVFLTSLFMQEKME
jgi:F-type H+-transporting ATPase subunit a